MKINGIETKSSVRKLFHIYLTDTTYGFGKDRTMVNKYILSLKKYKSSKNKKFILSHEFEVVEYKLEVGLPEKYGGAQHYYWIGIPEIQFCMSSGEELFYQAKHPHDIPMEVDYECEHSEDILEDVAFMENYIRNIKLKDILE